MLIFNYGSPYFWDKIVLTKFISGCRMVWDLIWGMSWFHKSKTEKVTGGGKSAILLNWCCLLCITVHFTHPWKYPIETCVSTLKWMISFYRFNFIETSNTVRIVKRNGTIRMRPKATIIIHHEANSSAHSKMQR